MSELLTSTARERDDVPTSNRIHTFLAWPVVQNRPNKLLQSQYSKLQNWSGHICDVLPAVDASGGTRAFTPIGMATSRTDKEASCPPGDMFLSFAGLRSAGIQVDMVDENSENSICGERPVVHSINSGLETGLSKILELECLAVGISTQNPPHKAVFIAGDPAEMARGFGAQTKSKIVRLYARIRALPRAEKFAYLVILDTGVESLDESRSCGLEEVCYLAGHACPTSTLSLGTASDNLFSNDVPRLYT